jgi:hypothetical protein
LRSHQQHCPMPRQPRKFPSNEIRDSKHTLKTENIIILVKKVIKYLLTNIITTGRKQLHKYWNCPMINHNLCII